MAIKIPPVPPTLSRPEDIAELIKSYQRLLAEPGSETAIRYFEYLKTLTSQSTPQEAYDVLTNWYFQLGGKAENLAATVPTGKLEELEEELLAREAAQKEAAEKGKEETEQLIEALKQRKIKVAPREEIPAITLEPEEKEKLHALGKAAKMDPGAVQQEVEKIIVQSLEKSPEEIKTAVPRQTITKVAVDLIERTRPFGEYKVAQEIPTEVPSLHPVSPITALAILSNAKLKDLITNDEERRILAQNAQAVSLALESERNVNSTLAASLFPGSENIVSVLYGPDQITQFEVAEDQETEEGFEIDIKEIIDQGKNIQNIWQKLATREVLVEEVTRATSTFIPTYTPSTLPAVASESSTLLAKAIPTIGAIYGLRQGILISSWLKQNVPLLMSPQVNALLTAGGAQSLITTSNIVSSKILFNISLGNFSFKIATASTRTGADLFIAGAKFGEKAFGVVAGRTPTTAAVGTITAKAGALTVKTVASGLLAKVAAFLATPFGGFIGAAIGWLVGKIIEKIPWDKVKKAAPYIIGLLVGVPAAIFLGPAIGVAAGVGTFALLGGIGLGGIGLGVARFFGSLGGAFIVTIGTPVIITLLVFPVLVALILFIINSGAYLVPPFDKYASFKNPYISIEKMASPPGPFENTDLPKEITYTITIKAKKSTLIINSWKHECTAYKEGGKVNCGSPLPPDQLPITVSPASDFTFTYKAKYEGSKFFDSAIINTFSVTADTPEEKNISTSGSATVIVGEPPIKCFKFDASWKKYANSQENMTQAIANLSEADIYLATLCQGNKEITLSYSGKDVGYGGEIVGDGEILFHYAGVYIRPLVTLYTLIHETGHVYAQRTSVDEEYYDNSSTAEERPICTYPFDGHGPSEDFAEMIALYVTKVAGSTKAGCLSNFKTQYPNHWRFAHDKIFKENLGW